MAIPTNSQEIDIVTTPERVLFNVSNMKPGDRATRTLTISNSGKQVFSYLSSADKKTGSDELYKALLLTVSDANGEVYKGSLGDFEKFEPRTLASQGSEELVFLVEFPAHLGNEYQGLECEVEFKFYVEGTLGGVLPVDGLKLPNTTTNTFNFIAAGIVIIAGGLIFYRYQNRKKQDAKLT